VKGEDGPMLKATNVTSGDVFFCGGQSNMVFPMRLALNADAEIATLAHFPNFRFFMTGLDYQPEPQWDLAANVSCDGKLCNQWVVADTTFLADFSAICYMTARDIARLHIGSRPVGLIQSAWNGTRVEAWMSSESLASTEYAAQVPGPGKGPQNAKSVLYNAMVAPWQRFAVRAVIWNQGEANADQNVVGIDKTRYYAAMYQAMIADWRDKKGMGDFAWLTLSLPPSVASGTDTTRQMRTGRMEIRLAQADVETHPGCLTDISGTAVALDLGGKSSWGIDHAPNKSEMARRLALQAVHVAHAQQGRFPSLLAPARTKGCLKQGILSAPDGEACPPSDASTTTWTGPVLAAVERRVNESAILLMYKSFSSQKLSLRDVKGLNSDNSSNDCKRCCSGAPPFDITMDGDTWETVARDKVLIGDSIVELRVQRAELVRAVRYAWLDYVECVLQNGDGLPAGPFRRSLRSAAPESFTQSDSKLGAAISSPPMGFNSWNFYHCNIDENTVKAVVDAMASNGMKDVGYEYVNIDDCWQVERFQNGTIQPDPVRFPSGMKALADYAHSKGLKFGVYTARGSRTCQNRPGAYMHEEVDAATYCDWGLDYLKNDNCGGTNWRTTNTSWIKFTEAFEECYKKTGRYIVRSVEYCREVAGCGEWIAGLANLWRTTHDIQATWPSVMSTIHSNNDMAPVARPGHFNDPDMLQIGNVGLSVVEQYTHMSLWCVAGAPLLLGTDLLHASEETLKIVTNAEVIAINQDLGYNGGIQGVIVSTASSPSVEVWSKRLAGGDSYGVVLLNLDSAAANVTARWEDLGGDLQGPASVRDLWAHRDLGIHQDTFTAEVESHGAAFVKVSRHVVSITTAFVV